MKFWIILATVLVASAFADSPGPHQNPFRAYPPSCLADPLPTVPSGPTWIFSTQLPLDSNVLPSGWETEQVTFWRVPCAGAKSALLGRIDRPPNDGSAVPTMPGFFVTTDSGSATARVSSEPNTVRSRVVPGTSFYDTYPSDEGYATVVTCQETSRLEMLHRPVRRGHHCFQVMLSPRVGRFRSSLP